MAASSISSPKPGARPAHASHRVGVVLPVCNGARTVGAAIDSIVAQTFPDWRLYVVIDRSTDDTVGVVRERSSGDPRIVAIENEERRGLPFALNVGWLSGVEPLIARADADDVCMPDRFARQVAFLDGNPTVDVLGTGVELAHEDGSVAGIHRRPASHEELSRKIFRECPFMHPSVMMRRSFLEELGGYDENLRVAEDYDLWFRGVREHRYANLQDLLVRYTVSASSSSTKWAHTVGAADVLFRNGALLGRRAEGTYFGVRYLIAGALTRVGVRKRKL